MPRVRFGQVHVANNLFDSKQSSNCVRAGYKADLRVENNVFIGVKKPIDLYEENYTAVSATGNYFEGTSGNTAGNKTAFTPSYKMTLTDVSNDTKAYALRDSIKNFAGATLPAPGAALPSSSSVKPSSSSVASSSSSVVSSSSSSINVTLPAALEKHGSGSANQTVAPGDAIVTLYYTWVNATGASVVGLPPGITYSLDESAQNIYIQGTVEAKATPKDYAFTVTTVGNSTNVSKSGVIKVSGTTAIENSRLQTAGFNVFPSVIQSMTSVSFVLKNQGPVTLSVMGLSGRVMFIKKWDASIGINQTSVSFSEIPAGVYYVQVQSSASR